MQISQSQCTLQLKVFLHFSFVSQFGIKASDKWLNVNILRGPRLCQQHFMLTVTSLFVYGSSMGQVVCQWDSALCFRVQWELWTLSGFQYVMCIQSLQEYECTPNMLVVSSLTSCLCSSFSWALKSTTMACDFGDVFILKIFFPNWMGLKNETLVWVTLSCCSMTTFKQKAEH